MADDGDAGVAELTGQLGGALQHGVDVRVIQGAGLGVAHVVAGRLAQVGRVRIELDLQRGRDDRGFRRDLGVGGRGEGGGGLVLVFLEAPFGGQLLDDREVGHLIEADRAADQAQLAVDRGDRVPGPLEVGGAVGVEEELAVLGEVRGVGVGRHPLDLLGIHAVAVGHPLDGLREGRRLAVLDHLHAFEDALDQAGHDLGMVLGEVGADCPDVGDQLVGLGGGGQKPGPGNLLGDVVDVGSPGDAGVDAGIRNEGRGGLEGRGRVLDLDVLQRVEPGGDQEAVDVVLRGAVDGIDQGLALQVAHALDGLAHDDAVSSGGPVDLLEDPQGRPRVLGQLFGEQDHHVQGAPQDVALT